MAGPACCWRLQAAARRAGQFYPPDPTETGASIGGNIATNASGSRSFKYGPTRRWVERSAGGLAEGSVRELERGEAMDFDPGEIPLPAVTKNTAGYLLRPGMDWVDLFVGFGGHARRDHRGASAPASSAEGGAGAAWFSSPATMRRWTRWSLARRAAGRACWNISTPLRSTCFARAFRRFPRRRAPRMLIEQESIRKTIPRWTAWLERMEGIPARWRKIPGSRCRPTIGNGSGASAMRLPELVNDTVRRSGAMKMNTDFAVPLARNREMLA